MLDIKSMTMVEMGDYFRQLGEPAFRAKQVFTWLHRGVKSFDEMSNLSKEPAAKAGPKLSYYRAPGGQKAGVSAGRNR